MSSRHNVDSLLEDLELRVSPASLRALKQDVRRKRKAEKRLAREIRLLHRRCFFTRPLGHVYTTASDADGDSETERCVACGKPRY